MVTMTPMMMTNETTVVSIPSSYIPIPNTPHVKQCLTSSPSSIIIMYMRNSRHHHSTINTPAPRGRNAFMALTIVILVAGTYFLAQAIDSDYDYSCPSMLVTAIDDDTLSGITERYCIGNTLQASWDIAQERGSSSIAVGDIIKLGDK